MSAFYVDPIFTTGHVWWFAGLLAFSLALTFAFSPRRRAMLGAPMFLLATGLQAAPALAGVTLVRGATRLGYLEEGRGFLEANLRSFVWMSLAIMAGQAAVRWLPVLSWPGRDLREADKMIWKERLGRWFGRKA